MPNAQHKLPRSMTVAQFLDWPGDGSGRTFQLIDGELLAMSPGSATHATIQANLARLIGNVLVASGTGCRIGTEPGVGNDSRSSSVMRTRNSSSTLAKNSSSAQLMS